MVVLLYTFRRRFEARTKFHENRSSGLFTEALQKISLIFSLNVFDTLPSKERKKYFKQLSELQTSGDHFLILSDVNPIFEIAKRELSSFTPNLEVVYQHPTYKNINYIKPDKSGTQILKDNHYIIQNKQHTEQYSYDALGGLPTILKTRLGMSVQFVNQFFPPH